MSVEYKWSAEINMEPVPKGRPRFTSQGHAYTPSKTRDAESFLREMLIAQKPLEPFDGPLSVRVVIYLEKPKSATNRRYPCKRPDLDNFVKLVLDAAQKAEVFNDDGQICELICYKRYAEAESPGVILSVTNL